MTTIDGMHNDDGSFSFQLEQLGAPGSHGRLVLGGASQFGPEVREIANRDTSLRPFVAAAKLGRRPADAFDINPGFDSNDGDSLLVDTTGSKNFEIEANGIVMNLSRNQKSQFSMVTAKFDARSSNEAIGNFQYSLGIALDRLSFVGRVPFFSSNFWVEDVTYELTYLPLVVPNKVVKMQLGRERLHRGMQPIYSIYREAMNSPSPYFSLFCHYKIMEGLVGPLRREIFREAEKKGVKLTKLDESVPDHKDIRPEFRSFIGRPIKAFFEKSVVKEYRNCIAHFKLKSDDALNFSDPTRMHQCRSLVFLTDLCVRRLIENHEMRLSAIWAAQPCD